MRGSLRLRHAITCPARGAGRRTKDARACRCSPVVQGRVGNVQRRLGYLELGWRAVDLVPYERQLGDLRDQVLSGRTPRPTRVVTLDEFVSPWFEKVAAQVELGRMSPLTFNQYEGVWRATCDRPLVACRSARSTSPSSRGTCARSSPRAFPRRR